MAALGGLTNGLGGGLGGGGGPLGAASGLTGTATNALPGGLDGATGSLPGGLGGALPGLGGGDGGGGGLTDGVTGLAGGLLGGGQGLNLLNLVGVGSDDDALLNINPAEHKKVKAAKAAQAAQNQKKRDAAMRQLQEQIKKQGGKPTPDQEKFMQELRESEAKDRRDMERVEQMLGPTDPDEFQKAMVESDAAEAAQAAQKAQTLAGPSATSGSGAHSSGQSDGLFYAYLVNANTHSPTHTLTFASPAAADEWFRQASSTNAVQRVSPQMYMYSGVPPRPSGKMACMPNTSSAPILPLQRADGYPICCKPGNSSNVGTSYPASNNSSAMTNNPYTQQPTAPPAPPPRQRFTFNDAAKAHAEKAKQNGDPRPMAQIYQEAMRDLKDDCPKQSGEPTSSGQSVPNASNTMSNGFAPNVANGTASGTYPGGPGNPMSTGTGAAPGNSVQPSGDNSGSDALNALGLGGLTSGLLGSGPGLNVAGILAIGSDQDAAIHLSPAERREDKMKKAKMLQDQQKTQEKQMQALQEQIKRQNGQMTPQQAAAMKELQNRDAAVKQTSEKLREGMKKDELEMQQSGGGAPLAGGGGPLAGATGAVPGGLPGVPALPGGAPALPAGLPAVGGGGLPGGIGL